MRAGAVKVASLTTKAAKDFGKGVKEGYGGQK
jgi:hypothetical protein